MPSLIYSAAQCLTETLNGLFEFLLKLIYALFFQMTLMVSKKNIMRTTEVIYSNSCTQTLCTGNTVYRLFIVGLEV